MFGEVRSAVVVRLIGVEDGSQNRATLHRLVSHSQQRQAHIINLL